MNNSSMKTKFYFVCVQCLDDLSLSELCTGDAGGEAEREE